MKLIVITTENPAPEEGIAINMLFKEGLELLHIRKPTIHKEELKDLFMQIDPLYHQRIVLHDHFPLAVEFQIKGIHLNRRNREKPADWQGTVSCSCHSKEDLQTNNAFDYVFLSPIFDSISKKGYKQAFTEDELIDMRQNRQIDKPVIALGGITVETIPQAARYGFDGVAVLGALWEDWEKDHDLHKLQKRFHQLQQICKHL